MCVSFFVFSGKETTQEISWVVEEAPRTGPGVAMAPPPAAAARAVVAAMRIFLSITLVVQVAASINSTYNRETGDW